jgi:hypothetical protein
LPAVIVLTARVGHVGAAIGYLLAGSIAVPINLANLCSCLGLPLLRFLGPLWRPLLATASMAVTVYGVRALLGPADSAAGLLAHLAASVGVGALTYASILLLFWQLSGRPEGAERWILDLLQARLRRLRSTPP